jgi:hypothetical protein
MRRRLFVVSALMSLCSSATQPAVAQPALGKAIARQGDVHRARRRDRKDDVVVRLEVPLRGLERTDYHGQPRSTKD